MQKVGRLSRFAADGAHAVAVHGIYAHVGHGVGAHVDGIVPSVTVNKYCVPLCNYKIINSINIKLPIPINIQNVILD